MELSDMRKEQKLKWLKKKGLVAILSQCSHKLLQPYFFISRKGEQIYQDRKAPQLAEDQKLLKGGILCFLFQLAPISRASVLFRLHFFGVQVKAFECQPCSGHWTKCFVQFISLKIYNISRIIIIPHLQIIKLIL